MSTTPVSAILVRLSYELHALAEETDEFHHLAFGESGARSLADADFVRATQRIDHTQQILANLSDFVACLAMASPERLQLDMRQALSLITLSDLRDRLCEAKPGLAQTVETEKNDGELELFF